MIADFHIHSRFAGACSKAITLDKLEQYAKIKGLDIIGTGDFQHPIHFREILENLSEDEHGILWSKNKFPFVWQTEVSLAYTQGGRGRRIHHIILAPSREVVEQITEAFLKKGRVDYDGRPIFGMSSIELVEMMQNISTDIEIIPAHAWTSWFGVFGSKSGFNSLKECFEEKEKYIHAIETGMSSDPAMNWRLSFLDGKSILSFSDIHSFWPWRFGREATIFNTNINYTDILHAIRTGNGIVGTIETPPAYGKYHYDGHRLCKITMNPEESKKAQGICPVCKNKLTLGVAYRVNELADRKEGFKPENAQKFYNLVPLTELIASAYNIKQLASKKVWDVYNKLIHAFGNEYTVLLHAEHNKLAEIVDEKLARIILMNRNNRLEVKPGYDGVYGEIILDKKDMIKEQKTLGEY